MTLLDQALLLVTRGFAVFPLAPNDKVPATGHGFMDATRDADHVRYWWRKMPNANIGLATGPRSGCWVLDVDNKPAAAGYESLQRVQAQHGIVTSGYMVATATSGLHIYYRWDESRPVRNHTNRPAQAIDVRGKGGYVVAAGSVRSMGEYVAVSDGTIAAAPDWLLDMIEPIAEARPIPPRLPVLDVKGESDKARAALDRLNRWRADDYDSWVRVGMSLFTLGNDGLALWEHWSAKSAKYKQGECARKWQSFDSDGVSLASLMYWAEQDSPRQTGRRTTNYAGIINHGI